MNKNTTSINQNIIFKTIILFLFAIVFCITVVTGTVYNFVHQRHLPMIIFAIIIFITTGILMLTNSMHTTKTKISWYDLIYLIPLLIYFFSTTTLKLSSISQNIGTTISQTESNTQPESNTIPIPELVDGKIIMDTERFFPWLNALYEHTDNYLDTPVEITGELFIGERFAENQFAVGRLLMVCCAADMQAIGIMCQHNTKNEFQNGDWVKITGTVAKQPYKKTFEPVIIINTIEKQERPKRTYVSPF